jgi:glyoxylase-like metal-dependent hydrolase (beta-lactamase superfamily II)
MDPKPDIVPGVHRLGSSLVNWYLVEDEGRLTAVDAGLPGFKGRLEADLAALGHSLSEVDAVVLTHADSDHTGVAGALRNAGAKVMVHSADEAALRTGKRKSTDGSPTDVITSLWRPSPWMFLFGMIRDGGASPTKVEGAITFSDGDVLDVPGQPRVIATPGHTPGHCVLLFEKHGALFVGDQLCTLNPLTGKRESRVMPGLMNVSTPQAYESLSKLEGLQADVLCPGHGEPWHDGVQAAVAHARQVR